MKSHISDTLLEAAALVLCETKEPKFKVGDEVATRHSSSWGSANYSSPGKVVKTNAHGHMHVDHTPEGSATKHIAVYNHDGSARPSSTGGYVNTRRWLVPKKEMDDHVAHSMAKQKRTSDLRQVATILDNHKSMDGHYHPIPQHHIDQIHELLKKHVAPPEKTSTE